MQPQRDSFPYQFFYVSAWAQQNVYLVDVSQCNSDYRIKKFGTLQRKLEMLM